VEQYIRLFLAYLSYEKGLSGNTRQAYGRDLNRLLAYVRDRHPDITRWEDLNKNSLIEFLKDELDAGAEYATAARRLSSIKSFYKFLLLENHIQVNPATDLETPKIKRKLPQVWSIEEINKLMEQPNVMLPLGLRDRAMLELMYGTGVRVS
jgi:integrase/recombinase XerD